MEITINGKAYTEEQLNVKIPTKYRESIQGLVFKDFNDFGQAYMHMKCEQEARFEGVAHKVKEHETAVKSYIRSRKTT